MVAVRLLRQRACQCRGRHGCTGVLRGEVSPWGTHRRSILSAGLLSMGRRQPLGEGTRDPFDTSCPNNPQTDGVVLMENAVPEGSAPSGSPPTGPPPNGPVVHGPVANGTAQNSPELALLSSLVGRSDAVELAYEALDLVGALYHLPKAHLLLRADPFVPQVFTLGRGHVPVPWAEDFTRRPSGLYTTADDEAAEVPMAVRDTITAYCEMALSAQMAKARVATDATTGLAARSVLDDAVRRAANCSGRYRWPFSMVLITTTGPGAPGARWQLLGDALHRCRRATDVVGVAGPGLAMVVLANSGSEGVDPFLGRLRSALAETATEVGLLAGAASSPADSVDPEQLWRLCEIRLADSAP